MSTASAAASPGQPGSRAGFWARIMASKFLFFSILAHLLFGLGATCYVVQRYSPKRKLTFQGGPPTVNASKQALEHKVAMGKKKTMMSAPAQAKRITVNGMSKISLPEMPSMPTATEIVPGKMAGMGGVGIGMGPGGGGMGGGGGFGGGGGGSIPFFGFRDNKSGGSLAGYLYDLKQTKEHKPTGMEPDKYGGVLQDFIRNGWDEKVLGEYFKSPKPLYTTQIFIPDMTADEAPKAFDVDRGPHKVEPKMWAALYKGKVTAPFSGRFRFVGFADDILEVRFGGEQALSAGCHIAGGLSSDGRYVYDFLESNRQGWYGGMGDRIGKWMTVQQGAQYDLEILIGEQPGGYFCAHLLWEQEGSTYDKDKSGNPKLPIFQMMAGKPQKTKLLPPFDNDKSLVWKGPGRGSGSLLDALKRPGS